MNTPAHLIFAMAAFARPGHRRRNLAAAAGALVPDLSLYLLASWSLFVQGTSPRVVFGELYFSDAWQAVFAVDNSVFVWLAVLALGLLIRSPVVAVLGAAALLHVAFDLPLHHDDGRPHFWPLSDWVFESPLSYWDPRAHGRWVGAAEVAACLIFLALLWRRFNGVAARSGIAVVALALVAPTVIFGVMFS